jgi:hypothetical protein
MQRERTEVERQLAPLKCDQFSPSRKNSVTIQDGARETKSKEASNNARSKQRNSIREQGATLEDGEDRHVSL